MAGVLIDCVRGSEVWRKCEKGSGSQEGERGWIGNRRSGGEVITCLKDASSMAVGTEVAHPVNILDGVRKVPVAVSSKEIGAAGDNGVEQVAAEATIAEANLVVTVISSASCSVAETHPVSLSSIAEGGSDESQLAASPSASAEKVTCCISISRVQVAVPLKTHPYPCKIDGVLTYVTAKAYFSLKGVSCFRVATTLCILTRFQGL